MGEVYGMRRNHGNARSVGRRARDEGSALIVALVMITAVLLIGGALFAMGVAESDLVDYGSDSSQSFYLAEGGIERATTWLQELAQQYPPKFPQKQAFDGQGLGEGTYDVDIKKKVGSSEWASGYDIWSTGTVDGVSREIHVVIQRQTFAQYVYFADESATIWFITGNHLDGPVHVNGLVNISGDPWFEMIVTTAEDEMNIRPGSDPIFDGGYELGVDYVPLPAPDDLALSLATMATSDGVHGGPLSGQHAKYEVEIGRNGNLGTLSYRSYSRSGGSYHWSGWTDVDISATNGICWFDEPVFIEGTLRGQLTVGSAANINITDNILYEDSTPGSGPNPGCNDILGLVSAKNVVVYDSTPNLDDCEIHAHMLALDKSFTARNYDEGAPRGELTIWGGLAQQKIGPVGQFVSGHVIIHGYNKNYHFDRNFMTNSPPGYPATGKYYVVEWEEIKSPTG